MPLLSHNNVFFHKLVVTDGGVLVTFPIPNRTTAPAAPLADDDLLSVEIILIMLFSWLLFLEVWSYVI